MPLSQSTTSGTAHSSTGKTTSPTAAVEEWLRATSTCIQTVAPARSTDVASTVQRSSANATNVSTTNGTTSAATITSSPAVYAIVPLVSASTGTTMPAATAPARSGTPCWSVRSQRLASSD